MPSWVCVSDNRGRDVIKCFKDLVTSWPPALIDVAVFLPGNNIINRVS